MNRFNYVGLTSIVLLYATFLVIFAVIGAITVPYHDVYALIFDENRIVELLTLLLYFAACLVIWRIHDISAALRIALIVPCLFLVGREMDLDTAFTSMSIVRTKFYFTPEFPFLERVISAALLASVGGCILYSLSKLRSPFWNGLKTGEAPSVLVMAGILFIPFSKAFDKGVVNLVEYGVEVSGQTMEESLELLIPASFLAAALLARRHRQEKRQRAIIPSGV